MVYILWLGRTVACVVHCRAIQNSFPDLKSPCAPLVHPSPHSLAPMTLFTLSLVWSFPEGHIVGILPHVAFSDWLLQLSDRH